MHYTLPLQIHKDKYRTYCRHRDGGDLGGFSRMADMVYSDGFCPVGDKYFKGFLYLLTISVLRATDGAHGIDHVLVAQTQSSA